MLLITGIVIFLIGCIVSSVDDSNASAQRREAQFRAELMRELEESRKENEAKKLVPPNCSTNVMPKQEKRARRRIIKDKDGNILAEEITEEIING